MRYILASQSPRRRELLARTGLEFDVIPSDVNEKITKEVPTICCPCLQTAHIRSTQVFH